MNPLIFRSYDIRGIYGKDLTDEVAQKIGVAIADFLDCDTAIARDMRNSSEAVMKSVSDGIRSTGKNVYDLGLLPFGPGMFYAWRNGLAFVHITASHLGKEWGGIKIFRADGGSLIDEEICALRDIILGNTLSAFGRKGKTVKIESKIVLDEYKRYLVGRLSALKPPKKTPIIIDCGNGMAGLIAKDLFTAAGFGVSVMFEDLDGSFPNRSSEPTDESLSALKGRARNCIGIAYDGDADRTVFVDERGRVLKAEQLASAILPYLTKDRAGPVIANVECTRMMEKAAAQLALPLERIRVGHPYLVKESRRLGAIIGVEDSGHFIIPSLLPFGDAIAASLYAACVLSGTMLADAVDKMPHFPCVKNKFVCSDRNKFTVVENLKAVLKKEYKNINTIDGVRVDTPVGWALIRPSNTEPIIRLTAEGESAQALTELEKKFTALLHAELKKFGE